MISPRRIVVACALPIALAACAPTSSTDATLSAEALESLTHSFASVASSASKGGAGGDVTSQGLVPFDVTPQGGAGTLSSCSPATLTPPVDCAGGGNIYTTINLTCSEPSGCCGANPACASDKMGLGGQGTLNYNSCRLVGADGTSVVVAGALFDGLTANFTVTCAGGVSGKLVYTITGNLSVRVNGHEVCNGSTMLTVTATVNQSIAVTVHGSICGEQVQRVYSEGCVVSCGGSGCCSGGTTCSTCSNSCLPAGAVDCCNGNHCPAGMRCVSNGSQCAL